MNNYVIKVPNQVENDYMGFVFLTNLFNITEGFQNIRIELDFSKTRWFEANLASVLGAWIEQKLKHNCRIVISKPTRSVEKIFLKNGFFEKYNLGTLDDTFDSTIKYEVFTVEQVEDFANYVTENVIPKIRLELSNSIMKSLRLSLNEIFLNVKLHAGSQKVYTCGQYYHTYKKVAFTITDLGNTIGYNVQRKINNYISDDNAIDWATKYGHTTKEATDQGGIGLHIIDEFLTKNKGQFQIISGNGFWENNKGIINSYKMGNYSFPGTVVNIITKLENTFSWEEEISF